MKKLRDDPRKTDAGFTLSDGSYQDVADIYGSLPDNEKEYVTPGRRVYKDVPKAVFARTVAYSGKDPVGFLEMYGPYRRNWSFFRRKPGYFTVETAVKPGFRGHGLASLMSERSVGKVLDRILENRARAASDGFADGKGPLVNEPDQIEWVHLPGNSSSARAAIRSGFSKGGRNKYVLDIAKALEAHGK